MMIENVRMEANDLEILCIKVKEYIYRKEYCESEELIKQAMAKFPHAPEPHNFMGIQLENEGKHTAAMKHFRAAWALDPTYLPARYNISQYADFYCRERIDAYVETDCLVHKKDRYKIEYDENGIGHTVIRDENNGIIGRGR